LGVREVKLFNEEALFASKLKGRSW